MSAGAAKCSWSCICQFFKIKGCSLNAIHCDAGAECQDRHGQTPDYVCVCKNGNGAPTFNGIKTSRGGTGCGRSTCPAGMIKYGSTDTCYAWLKVSATQATMDSVCRRRYPGSYLAGLYDPGALAFIAANILGGFPHKGHLWTGYRASDLPGYHALIERRASEPPFSLGKNLNGNCVALYHEAGTLSFQTQDCKKLRGIIGGLCSKPATPNACGEGWTEINGGCYYIIQKADTYLRQSLYCSEMGGDLINRRGQTQQAFNNVIAGLNLKPLEYWIGYDKGYFTLPLNHITDIYGNIPNGAPFVGANPSGIVCVTVNKHQNWLRRHCQLEKPAICRKHANALENCPPGAVKLATKCITILKQKQGRAQARQNCLNIGGDLLSVASSGKTHLLKELFKVRQQTSGYAWINLRETATNGAYVWGDGSSYGYTFWKSGQPNDPNPHSCGSVSVPSAKWFDVKSPCSQSYYVPCEYVNTPCTGDSDCSTSFGECSKGQCRCKTGYHGDGKNSCVDINECLHNPCDSSATGCLNTPGSFTCKCPNGYTGAGTPKSPCEKARECRTNADCATHAECNKAGECKCKNGFTGIGKKLCTDILECDATPKPCDPNADCSNTIGSFRCTCRNGYIGNGRKCRALPRHCQEIYDKNNRAHNGRYWIDPDFKGHLRSCRVSCRFENGRGITIFPHNRQRRTEIPSDRPPKTYSRRLSYNGVYVSQIVAVINQMSFCRQRIRYQVRGPLSWYDNNVWEDRTGFEQQDLVGVNIGGNTQSGQCPCYLGGGLCKDNQICNCNENNQDGNDRTDEGYIIDKSVLPVTRFKGGGTESGLKRGWITIGELECATTRFGLPKNCQDAKDAYRLRFSGMVLIDVDGTGPIEPFYCYCDVSSFRNTAVTECGSFSRNYNILSSGTTSVIYPRTLPLAGLKKLAKDSEFCQQTVTFQCNNSPPSSTPIVGPHGNSGNYWASSAVCPCGDTLTCAENNPDCNCMVEDGKDRHDHGTVTDKSKLPVTGFDTASVGTKARLTIGRLRCGSEQFGIYGSCQDYRLHGFRRSGNYWIDPDGPPTTFSPNTSPFLAYCKMESAVAKAVTTIYARRKSYITSGDADAEFDFKYTASREQISDLIKRSAYCTQEIIYDCKRSAIFGYSSSNKVNWYSELDDTKALTYFHGDGTVEKCKCGFTGSCTKSSNKCNCDSFSHHSASDHGVLSNKGDLPVGRMTITGLTSSSSVRVRLGPLQCYELFGTCKELKQKFVVNRGQDELEDGLYVIDPDLSGTVSKGFRVFCNFPWTRVLTRGDRGTASNGNTRCRDVTYSATSKELKLLAKRSATCQQRVNYQAVGSPFPTNVRWKDNHGNQANYWGNTNGLKGCGCGVLNKCTGGPDKHCNTETPSGKQTDRGWLINKLALPVQHICITAGSNFGSYAKYVLGPLICGPTYQGIFRDCQDFRRFWRKTADDVELLDADGSGPAGIFPAYCDYTNDPPQGTTVITPKDESCINIPAAGGEITVEYNGLTTAAQAAAIAKTSTYCFQEISFECVDATLDLSGTAGWYAADGSEQKSWGGNSKGTGCAGGACKCAGQSDGVRRTDGGFLLNKDLLPVSKFIFKPGTGKRCIKVGPLKCFDVDRDCEEIRRKRRFHNINRNNRYAIDPDQSGGQPFFGATCSFRFGYAITTIPRSSSSVVRTETTGPKDITYRNANKDQVRALVDYSVWCKQGLSYQCKNALLINKNAALNTYFVAFDGTRSTVWSTADHKFGQFVGCACALLGTCPPNQTCKCDTQDGKRRLEGDFVTNKAIMPLIGVNRGKLPSGAQGRINIGDLQCGPRAFDLPQDCEDVRQLGLPTGEYLIQPKLYVDPFIVFCDMALHPGRGVTVISLTPGSKTVGSGDTLFDFVEATRQQAFALTLVSAKCYMPIRLECNKFRIYTAGGSPTIKWHEQNNVTAQNTLNDYWGGDIALGRDQCACGEQRQCGGDDGLTAQQARRCNCDVGDAVDRVDAGILKDKGDLPFFGIKNLGLSTGSLKVKVDKLYCADDFINLKVCTTEFHDCHQQATCIPLSDNRYRCQCNKGWRGLNVPNVYANGRSCYDDNECANNPCNNAATATCVNTPGSYRCDCKPGYVHKANNRNTCIDKDECKDGTHNCDPNADCINTSGSFLCACKRGFLGNGKKCAPVGECTCWGDPHCNGFDNKFFSYYGPCEYIMARDTCTNGVATGPPTFQVIMHNWRQGRTNTKGSWIKSVEIQIYGGTIHLLQKKIVKVNGYIIPGFVSRPFTSIGKKDLLILNSGPYVRVTAAIGLEVRWDGKTKVDVVVGGKYRSRMCGMCGDYNGDAANDYTTGSSCPGVAAGTVVTNSNTFATSHLFKPKTSECLSYCTKTPEDLCEGEGDKAKANQICNQLFSSSFVFQPCLKLMSVKRRANMKAACRIDVCGGGMSNCDIAENLARICVEEFKKQIIWRNPSFCGTPTCGKNAEYRCGTACEPNCAYPTGIPDCEDATCYYGCYCKKGFVREENECVPASNCGCTDPVSGIYVPNGQTTLVSCKRECTCTSGKISCKSHTCRLFSSCKVRNSRLTCVCNDGFEERTIGGTKVCVDKDECILKTDNCIKNLATCKNTVGSFTCKCQDGYTGNGIAKCENIDECTTGSNDCDPASTFCRDKTPGFTCRCQRGYTRNGNRGNRTHCINVDECTLNRDSCDDTSTTCEDTDGSYKCNCKTGYVRVDNTSCSDIDECDPKNPRHNCHPKAKCNNIPGSFTCTCKTGYKGNGRSCEDIEECKTDPKPKCGENKKCENTIGSFKCVCKKGYREVSGLCVDIDECAVGGNNNCVPTSRGGKCVNSPGSFSCTCLDGYTGDGQTGAGQTGCTDINECKPKDPCGANQRCNNTIPGFNCYCTPGYRRNRANRCVDIKECRNFRDHNCVRDSQGGICTDLPGTFKCSCKTGYTGNGRRSGPGANGCTNVNECTAPSPPKCQENADCKDLIGSYTCVCKKGYKKVGKACVDIDECKKGTDDCVDDKKGGKCTNTPGSFTCSCVDGYSGDGRQSPGTGCNDVNECTQPGSPVCGSNSKCSNEVPFFTCKCFPGYRSTTKDGKNCVLIPTCQNQNIKCGNGTCQTKPTGPECTCNTGFRKVSKYNCIDIDECAIKTDNCRGPHKVCINTIGSFKCGCEEGYVLTRNNQCRDVDECRRGKDNCVDDKDGGICRNSPGSFQCSCRNGYEGDGRKGPGKSGCDDINECTKPGRPACGRFSKCTNKVPGFSCECFKGYRSTTNDGKNCVLIPTCRNQNIQCGNGTCSNGRGGPKCTCNKGFKKVSKYNCIDIDECKANTDNCNGPHMICINTVPGFKCGCKKGFRLRKRDNKCINIDECKEATDDDCKEDNDGGICTDTIGSFRCSCRDGYEGDGRKGPGTTGCNDINECTRVGRPVCGRFSKCTNKVPGFSCECFKGYRSTTNDGKNCVLIPTCKNQNIQCGNGTCSNGRGGPKCTCNKGFKKVSKYNCIDIDECRLNTDNCNRPNMICINTEGSFKCSCKNGYRFLPRQHKCKNIDECKEGKDNCVDDNNGGRCEDTIGSFKCSCRNGYEGDGRKGPGNSGCRDINECTKPGKKACGEFSKCTNKVPGFSCECFKGYRSRTNDGKNCVLIPTCKNQNINCINGFCTTEPTGPKCTCNKGFRKVSKYKCIDINECKKDTDNCNRPNMICKNTIGSFKCGCKKGYRFVAKDHKCINIDECKEGSDNCVDENNGGRCEDTIGSFKCSCTTGYRGDGRRGPRRTGCKDINECTKVGRPVCGRFSKCTNKVPGFSCECFKGYRSTTNDGKNCVLIPTCRNQNIQCGNGTCSNDRGGPKCTCNKGFKKVSKYNCIDIDECTLNTDNCNRPNMICINTVPFFKCGCNKGYRFVAREHKCRNIDECRRGTDNCVDDNDGGKCEDTVGSFKCSCRKGYEGDGRKGSGNTGCKDVNECTTTGPPACGPNSKCTNEEPGFSCKCLRGYRSTSDDGKNCVLIPTCSNQNIQCGNGTCMTKSSGPKCTCNTGFTKVSKYNCIDIDECSKNTDTCNRPNMICINTVGGFKCDCNRGYKYLADVHRCRNIDECAKGADNCVDDDDGGRCKDTVGSFKCSCRKGYKGDGRKGPGNTGCKDINECTETNPAVCGSNSKCTNKEPGFSCKCLKGYRSTTNNGKNCVLIPTCGNQNIRCGNGTCSNDRGGPKCTCNKGFKKVSKYNCIDINECALNTDNCNGPNMICINTVPGFKCGCNKGYRFVAKDHKCINIDECKKGTDNCVDDDDGGRCRDTIGSFKCSCRRGYRGDGRKGPGNTGCRDINECTEPGRQVCGRFSKCTNKVPGFSCECFKGYRSRTNDGKNCVLIPTCGNQNIKCGNGTCTTEPSGPKCTCNKGFKKVSKYNCIDINECALNTDNCNRPNMICINTVPGFKCGCNKGYRFVAKDHKCINIDECREGTDNCVDDDDGGRCRDTVGSFKCSCRRGYRGDGRKGPGRTGCRDINECTRPGKPVCGSNSKCTNKEPGFSCACLPGYRSTTNDGKNCILIPTCSNQNIKCGNGTCTTEPSGPKCTCNNGFKKVSKYNCIDIDECKLNTDNCNSQNMICINTIGSFKCGCENGYRLLTNNKCRNIDECKEGKDNCVDEGNGGRCEDTIGSFKCSCTKGYEGDGRKGPGRTGCKDINECTVLGPRACGANSKCRNRVPGFSCKCLKGYRSSTNDGKNCVLIPTCGNQNIQCGNGTCSNGKNGPKCTCNKGFKKVSKYNCIDIDECSTKTHNCDDPEMVCVNEVGSFKCGCIKGYIYIKRSHKCQNLNECKEGTDDCVDDKDGGRCTDTKGSFKCSCRKGYEGDGKKGGKGCKDINECSKPVCGLFSRCTNKEPGFSCKCVRGYRSPTNDGKNCKLIPTCKNQNIKCINGKCVKVGRRLECRCDIGYVKVSKYVCKDIDECKLNTDNCNRPQMICENIPGSFRCNCKRGYVFKIKIHKCKDIDECAKGTHNCPPNSHCKNTRGGFECICNIGFTKKTDEGGKMTCENINECILSKGLCGANALCKDTIGSFKCVCVTGYKSNGVACVDIDECASGTHNCPKYSVCVDKDGGFNCVCKPGFTPTTPGDVPESCKDVDECARGNTRCSRNAKCRNTIGSYFCKCKKGYRGNGFVCTDINECDEKLDNCPKNSKCINKDGTFDCECDAGYIEFNPTPGTTVCRDKNECTDGTATRCDRNARCENTVGSYRCRCMKGYRGNGFKCTDIPECDENPCAVHATCEETKGSFRCTCNKGYQGNGFKCTNIDECRSGLAKCAKNAVCVDTPGGYICQCRPGYEGHCDDCWDINECETGLHNCASFSSCINTEGSFRCECKPGYIFRDGSCQDVNECLIGIDNCDTRTEFCENRQGSFICRCKPGYKRGSPGKSCIDIDECKEGLATCSANSVCTNTPGSFTCICKAGFTGDGRICQIQDPRMCGSVRCDVNANCVQLNIFVKVCICKPGYTGTGIDDRSGAPGCINVNSCEYRNRCRDPAKCVNVINGRICACPPRLYRPDGTGCIPVNPCDQFGICPPFSTCKQLPKGAYKCICNPGYKYDPLRRICSDVDECEEDEVSCVPNSECVNTLGSYKCVCRRGFRRLRDGSCQDINECNEDLDNCDVSSRATCTNTIGSFICKCKPFFYGNGIRCLQQEVPGCNTCPAYSYCAPTPRGPRCRCRDGFKQTSADPLVCEDINECKGSRPPCLNPLSQCINTAGRFHCICPRGYQGFGCRDVNECDDPRTCSRFATCRNTQGSHICTCRKHYKGDGKTCTLADPKDDTCGCGRYGICIPLTGRCNCNSGFAPDYTRKKDICQDIDDCLVPGKCHVKAICINKIGGYDCKCLPGYQGDGVNFCSRDKCRNDRDCNANAECKRTRARKECVCKKGFVGDGLICTPVRNPCLDLKCPDGAFCVPKGNRAVCECVEGYQGNGDICVDIDECIDYPPRCHRTAVCENSPGTFSCNCANGYRRSSVINGACVDVDECATGAAQCDTNADCHNTPGSYECCCRDGYTGDGKSCQPDTSCRSIGGCPRYSTCTRNSNGGHSCVCNDGYILRGITCVEVNECELKLDNCKDYEICRDTKPGFQCDCKPGYHKVGQSCRDINECSRKSPCGPNATCTNTPGSFRCVCPPGFVYTGTICIAINFCAKKPCSQHATCKNTDTGGFECTCNEGYIGNGLRCTLSNPCIAALCPANSRCDGSSGSAVCICLPGYKNVPGAGCVNVNECNEEDNDCNANADCTDTVGSYLCKCKRGYIGDGRICYPTDPCPSFPDGFCGRKRYCATEVRQRAQCICRPGYHSFGRYRCKGKSCRNKCRDIDECKGPGRRCSPYAVCVNTPGSFRCECKKGYVGNGIICIDVDECRNPRICGNGGKCENTAGSYTCKCPGGPRYGRQCSNVNECALPPGSSGAARCVNAVCRDRNDGYDCICHRGHKRLTRFICIDINECIERKDICTGSGKCINTPGAYTCECRPGFQFLAGRCRDINECAKYPDICGPRKYAICKNKRGSYVCLCAPGFRFDRRIRKCVDINECKESKVFPCHLSADCDNTVGGYQCICKPGYEYVNNQCVDINECARFRSPCGNGDCRNTLGSFKCVCQKGFIESGNTCRPICNLGTCRPHQHCRVKYDPENPEDPGKPSCSCDCVGPKCVEEGPVCGSNGMTYVSSKSLLECICRKRLNVTKLYDGVCKDSCADKGGKEEGDEEEREEGGKNGGLTCAEYENCEVLDGVARCTCKVSQCTLAGFADFVCTNKNRQLPRCLFHILKCLGDIPPVEVIDKDGHCIHETCVYDLWASWSPCSVTCGAGTRTRTRGLAKVDFKPGVVCTATRQSKRCINPPCAGDCCEGHLCVKPYSTCVNRGGRPVCVCPVCDTEPPKPLCAYFKGKLQTFQNYCHLKHDACRKNAFDSTFVHFGRCVDGPNLPLNCTALPAFSQVSGPLGTSRDSVRTNRCYGGCGNKLGVCCVPESVDLVPVTVTNEAGKSSKTEFVQIHACICVPREQRGHLAKKLLQAATEKGYIIPEVFKELLDGLTKPLHRSALPPSVARWGRRSSLPPSVAAPEN